jgi:hypothetical protein
MLEISTSDIGGEPIVKAMERVKEVLRKNKITADVHFSRHYVGA